MSNRVAAALLLLSVSIPVAAPSAAPPAPPSPAAAPPAAPARHPMTVEDLWSIVRPSAVAVSPDGTRVAYQATAWNLADNKGNTDLWWVPLAGGEPARLTRQPGSDSAPAWSPDGREIVLSRRTPDNPVAGQAWVLPASGGDGRFLPGGQGMHQTALSWSSDGRTLLSQRIPLQGMDPAQIWLHDVQTGEERQVGVGAWPRWLP